MLKQVREAVEQVERKFKRQVEKKFKRVKQDVKRALAYSGIVIYGERYNIIESL